MADGAIPERAKPLTVAEVEACRAELVDSGYTLVEIINHDADHISAGKAPIREGWQHGRALGPVDPRALNTGIVCTGLRAIDIDIDNPTIAAKVKSAALARFGEAPMRMRDNAPRVLLLYRAALGEPGKRSIVSKTGLGKVEVLGRGQQFVAYGIHASGAALRWQPEGPTAWAADSLPAVTEEQVSAFFEDIAPIIQADVKADAASGDDHQPSPLGQRGEVLDIIADLRDIPNAGPPDWDAWNRVGMALWAATQGRDAGREAWHAWSARNAAYDHAATEARWLHYWDSPPTEIGAGTVRHMAADARRAKTTPDDRLRFQLLTSSSIAGLPDRGYLLKGIMAPGEMSVWWGPPKCGKSFVVMHVAYALAQGRSVFGRRVRKSRVLYLACEGRSGLRGRITALVGRYGSSDDFLALAEPLDLWGTGDADALAELMIAHRIDLVVVDTLNRVMAGGDENSSADMGALIRHLDEIRTKTGAHVLVIHHGTKAGNNGPRGHGSLIGAADAIVEVATSDDGTRTVIITDAKDDASGRAMAFTLEVVELGEDSDGDQQTTCLVAELGDVAPRTKAAKQLSEKQRGWLRDIQDIFAEPDKAKERIPIEGMAPVLTCTKDEIRVGLRGKGRFELDELGKLTSRDRDRQREAFIQLKDKGKIAMTADLVWLL